jgi:hypothetical protein
MRTGIIFQDFDNVINTRKFLQIHVNLPTGYQTSQECLPVNQNIPYAVTKFFSNDPLIFHSSPLLVKISPCFSDDATAVLSWLLNSWLWIPCPSAALMLSRSSSLLSSKNCADRISNSMPCEHRLPSRRGMLGLMQLAASAPRCPILCPRSGYCLIRRNRRLLKGIASHDVSDPSFPHLDNQHHTSLIFGCRNRCNSI